jgi:hypothetical protein
VDRNDSATADAPGSGAEEVVKRDGSKGVTTVPVTLVETGCCPPSGVVHLFTMSKY